MGPATINPNQNYSTAKTNPTLIEFMLCDQTSQRMYMDPVKLVTPGYLSYSEPLLMMPRHINYCCQSRVSLKPIRIQIKNQAKNKSFQTMKLKCSGHAR